MSIRSRISRGIGYGSLAVAHLGMIGDVAPPVAPPVYASGGGSVRYEKLLSPVKTTSQRIRRNNDALLLLLLK